MLLSSPNVIGPPSDAENKPRELLQAVDTGGLSLDFLGRGMEGFT